MSEHTDPSPPDLATLFRQVTEAVTSLTSQHHADDGTATPTTCGVCPVCLGLAALSRNHPQVLTHLGEAMTALAAAAAAFTASKPASARFSEPGVDPDGPADGARHDRKPAWTIDDDGDIPVDD